MSCAHPAHRRAFVVVAPVNHPSRAGFRVAESTDSVLAVGAQPRNGERGGSDVAIRSAAAPGV